MKNTNNSGQFESSPSLAVSVTIDEIPLLKNMVEKLAHRRYDIGYGSLPMPKGWKGLETSTTETYVSGNLAIDADNNFLIFAVLAFGGRD